MRMQNKRQETDIERISLVVQWLRVCLAIQGPCLKLQVQSLVKELRTHVPWATALQLQGP